MLLDTKILCKYEMCPSLTVPIAVYKHFQFCFVLVSLSVFFYAQFYLKDHVQKSTPWYLKRKVISKVDGVTWYQDK